MQKAHEYYKTKREENIISLTKKIEAFQKSIGKDMVDLDEKINNESYSGERENIEEIKRKYNALADIISGIGLDPEKIANVDNSDFWINSSLNKIKVYLREKLIEFNDYQKFKYSSSSGDVAGEVGSYTHMTQYGYYKMNLLNNVYSSDLKEDIKKDQKRRMTGNPKVIKF